MSEIRCVSLKRVTGGIYPPSFLQLVSLLIFNSAVIYLILKANDYYFADNINGNIPINEDDRLIVIVISIAFLISSSCIILLILVFVTNFVFICGLTIRSSPYSITDYYWNSPLRYLATREVWSLYRSETERQGRRRAGDE